jgi:ribosomal-protein-alanine N-acetyltransferase
MSELLDFPTLSIATPTSDELPAIASLVNSCWHETYDEHLPATLCRERTEAVFNKLLKPRLGAASIARLGNRLVGYADNVSNCIDNLWVDSDYRRRRIGSRLLESQLGKLAGKQLQSAQAGCESFNEAAIGFYNHHGWQVLDETVENIEPGLNIGVIVYGVRFNESG